MRHEAVKLDRGRIGSIGYRLHSDGKVLAYSGDTRPCPGLDHLVGAASAVVSVVVSVSVRPFW